MSTPLYELSDLVVAQTRAGMARFAPNWLPCRVETYHPPEVIDGTAFPASVTVQALLEYVRVVRSPEEGAPPVRMAPGERILTGADAQAWAGAGDTSARYTVIARPYDPVRVPVIFSGSPELAVIAAPRAGDVGILMLAGRSIADALASASAPVLPEFMPNPLRLSDGCYLGHLLAGDSSAPAEGQPAADVAQLGPRDSRAGSVYLRLMGQAWTLEGATIAIGDGAAKGAARVGDPVAPDPAWTAWLTGAMTTIGAALIPPIVLPPQPAFGGSITAGSGTVTIKD